jgi:hypothetical protein
MTCKRIKRHFHCLSLLASANPSLRKAIIKACDKDFICCICECIKNVTEANVPIPHDSLKQLKRHRRILDKIVDKRTHLPVKKRLIVQHGGFLSILLPPLLGVIGSLVGETISKHVT